MHKFKKDDSNFSFGVRERRELKPRESLRLDHSSLTVVQEDRGSDPYNTSGSFDRTKHWARVGKR